MEPSDNVGAQPSWVVAVAAEVTDAEPWYAAVDLPHFGVLAAVDNEAADWEVDDADDAVENDAWMVPVVTAFQKDAAGVIHQ